MSRTVWKYPLPSPGQKVVASMPWGAKPLSVQMQDGNPVLWVECNSNRPTKEVELWTIGTGWDVPEYAVHLGTVQDGALVWHVYECGLQSGSAA